MQAALQKLAVDPAPGSFYSDDRADIRSYLLSISDMPTRRREALRIYQIREMRRRDFLSRLKYNEAARRRQARKARLARS